MTASSIRVILWATFLCGAIHEVVPTGLYDYHHADPMQCQTIPDELNQCLLAGKWKNQLQSVMDITCQDGQVDGRYKTAVGNAGNFYKLAGRYTMAGGNDTVLSWTVSWNNEIYGNSESSTAWSGIHYDEDGIIRTQWLLTRYKTRPNLWQTVMISHDEFERVC